MAAALGNVSSGSATSTSVTVSHTVAAGADTELLVGPTVAPGPTISDVTWNGVSINSLRDDLHATQGRSAIWYEDDPSGTHDVVVTISSVNRVIVGVADMNGAGTPDNATGSTGSAQTSASDTVASAGADDMVFDALRTNIATGATAGANQTEQWDLSIGSANAGAGSTQDGADGGVMSWTFSSADYAHSACRVPAAASAPSGTGAQSLPSLSQAGSGGQEFSAAGVQTLPSSAQAGAGVLQPEGAGAQALPALAQAGSGQEQIAAAGAQALPAATQSGTGLLVPAGSGAQALPSLVQAGAGSHGDGATGSGAQVLPAPTQASAGEERIEGTADQLLPGLRQAGQAAIEIPGAGAQVLPGLAQSGAQASGFVAGNAGIFRNQSRTAFYGGEARAAGYGARARGTSFGGQT